MATNADANAAGFITPAGTDLIRNGDDAISANARATVELAKSLAPRTKATDLGSVAGPLTITGPAALKMAAAAATDITIDGLANGELTAFRVTLNGQRVTIAGKDLDPDLDKQIVTVWKMFDELVVSAVGALTSPGGETPQAWTILTSDTFTDPDGPLLGHVTTSGVPWAALPPATGSTKDPGLQIINNQAGFATHAASTSNGVFLVPAGAPAALRIGADYDLRVLDPAGSSPMIYLGTTFTSDAKGGDRGVLIGVSMPANATSATIQGQASLNTEVLNLQPANGAALTGHPSAGRLTVTFQGRQILIAMESKIVAVATLPGVLDGRLALIEMHNRYPRLDNLTVEALV